jgi:hypothetical protein
MTRSIVTVAVIVSLLALGGLPQGTGAAAHTARGLGQDSQGQHFRFHAEGTPSLGAGRAAFGFGVSGQQQGTVDCLWVASGRAVLSGTLDAPIGGLPYFAILVRDIPTSKSRPSDLFYVQASSSPIDCATAYQPLSSGLRIRRGDIKVA